MGNVFRYIDDAALRPLEDSSCHHCGRADVPVYGYQGHVVDARLTADPSSFEDARDVYELCAACIATGNVRKSARRVKEVAGDMHVSPELGTALADAYHRTPDVLFLQRAAWPICCADLTEYVGDHPPPRTSTEDYEPWRPQDAMVARQRLANFYPLNELPMFHSMALFHCLHCSRKYWVFQYSGFG